MSMNTASEITQPVEYIYAPKKMHYGTISIGEQGLPPDYEVQASGSAFFITRVLVAASDAFEEDTK